MGNSSEGTSGLVCGVDDAHRVANRGVLLTGCGRTGTSVLGRVLASSRNVVYDYEPAILTALLAIGPNLSRDNFRFLWSTYVTQQLSIDALAGRGLNLNHHDESSAFSYLEPDEIHYRLSRSASIHDLISTLAFVVPLVKIPDVVSRLACLTTAYPQMKVIVTGRDPSAVIRSVALKGWFENEARHTNPRQGDVTTGLPFWLDQSWGERFSVSSPIDRAAIYYIAMHDQALQYQGVHLLSYQRLVSNPARVAKWLEDKLAIKPGPRTNFVISTVKDRQVNTETDVLSRVSIDLRKAAEETWEAWSAAEATGH